MKKICVSILTFMLVASVFIFAVGQTEKSENEETVISGAGTGKKVTIRFWHGCSAHDKSILEEQFLPKYTSIHPNIEIKTLAPISSEKMLTATAG